MPRRLEDNYDEDGESSMFQRLPSGSSLSFMLSSPESFPSRLVQPSTKKRRNSNSNGQRSKGGSIVEVFAFPSRGTSPLKPCASFSEGSRDSRRRGSLTLSAGTNILKRAGTSRSSGRRWSDLSQSSSVTTPTSCQSESMDEEDGEHTNE
ncbi:hypothetical protein IV203_019822 [Nitzschia inconspicua]|uniref:Uncharacterized protein n=1 Tax=Nitzschia inconspicua TaxID=303405 RepID=A0A9K3K5W8_9STRA|nr:hypothetical protein IV203_020391 [Nitzschia inconspicua]KAG7371252.1 hypothetical protein IV203_019822 [Nitzschia inconspicua]